MTQKEKRLLLKDLCGRLPYGVKIHINSCVEEQNQMRLFDVNLEGETIGVGNEKWAFRAIPIIDDEDETKVIKPYLRPMSSMTEEERCEFEEMFDFPFAAGYNIVTKETIVYDYIVIDKGYDVEISIDDVALMLDWLLSHHFDCHNLIQKGLALKAPEGMYPSVNI